MIITIPEKNPRVIIIQKLYSQYFNEDGKVFFKKHRYKKFIKDIVLGTLERKELIEETINNYLKSDINIKRTETLLIIMLHAAVYELLYRPQTSIKIIINEYLNASDFFLKLSQKKYLNAMLDKISKEIRI